MAGLLLPICASFFSLMLLIVYFSKKRMKIIENTLYSTMIICTFFDSILVSVLQILAVIDSNISTTIWIPFLNKIDFVLLIAVVTCLFMYTLIITYKNNTKLVKTVFGISLLIDLIFVIFMLLGNVELINNSGNFSVSGTSIFITAISCGVYIVLSFAIAIINVKKLDKRYIPIYSIIVLIFFLIFMYQMNPYLIIISIALTFVNYIMYFTIENPDLKVITELNIAKDQAEKANRAKSDFLSSMSHEIRTPLNAIVGLSEDMKEKDECPESMKEDLEDVVSASRTLLEIVGNIMDISKIESDKMEIIEVPYNFKEEIESLARINAVRIGDKQLELKVNIAEDIPYELVGDRGHVKEIVNNLLSNAIKYTDKGTVNLTVKCINENNICNLMISVEDTGRGIKKENIEKLFTKFERLDVERNTTTEGTGLGLAITKKLVELMGGKINVESEFGKGSIFIVHIPQRIGSMTRPITDTQLINTSEIVKESRKKRVNYKTKSILIVDDNKLNIKVARRSLEQLNFKVIDECYNGKECVDKIKNNEKYDIILMDIMMPIMSGETALEELKKIEGFNTPVIALTADAVAGAEERYEKEGFTSYISKPFNKDQIKIKLDSLFDNKKKVKELEEDMWKDAPTYVFTSSLAKDDAQSDEQQKEF